RRRRVSRPQAGRARCFAAQRPVSSRPRRRPSAGFLVRKPLIAGNWKMNGALAASRTLVSELRAGVGGATHADMLLCPPYVYLRDVAQWIAGSAIKLGAQDVCDREGSGAFTGEVSGAMLADVGCGHVIVGHSERRALYGETDAVVAAKFKA